MEKLNELVELAKNATPGPWKAATDWERAAVYSTNKDAYPENKRVVCSGNQNNHKRFNAEPWSGSDWNDAAFIAAANPATMLDIAGAFRALEQQRDALGAENAVMLELLTDISEQYQEVQTESEENAAVIDLDYISEVNTYVSRDVDGENPFSATDAYLNSVRAEGVEIFAKHCDESSGFIEPEDETLYTLMEEQARNFAAQLRAGKDGE